MKGLRTLIITGLSGGGKTTALHAVEDLGFYCVDNLPLPLLVDFIKTMEEEPAVYRVALVVDARLKHSIDGYVEASMRLRSMGHILEVLFLDARDEVLMRRFSETRRPHPLEPRDLQRGLHEERRLLKPLRDQATSCIDTSELTVHQLKQVIQDRYTHDGNKLVVTLLSFGFRNGLPSMADLVFDVRFLPNPYFEGALRDRRGTDPAVSEYVMRSPDAHEFLSHTESLLKFMLPRVEREGKVYFTVALGCTGGHHRSVAIVEELGRRLSAERSVNIRHRDLER